MVAAELDKLIEVREAFVEYLDTTIPKKANGIEFDFEKAEGLDAKTVHEHFFKLDYQARKLRGFLVHTYDIEVKH